MVSFTPRIAARGTMKKLMRTARVGALMVLALALMPWRGGLVRVTVYALMILTMVYPEVFPRRRRWVREVGEMLVSWRERERRESRP